MPPHTHPRRCSLRLFFTPARPASPEVFAPPPPTGAPPDGASERALRAAVNPSQYAGPCIRRSQWQSGSYICCDAAIESHAGKMAGGGAPVKGLLPLLHAPQQSTRTRTVPSPPRGAGDERRTDGRRGTQRLRALAARAARGAAARARAARRRGAARNLVTAHARGTQCNARGRLCTSHHHAMARTRRRSWRYEAVPARPVSAAQHEPSRPGAASRESWRTCLPPSRVARQIRAKDICRPSVRSLHELGGGVGAAAARRRPRARPEVESSDAPPWAAATRGRGTRAPARAPLPFSSRRRRAARACAPHPPARTHVERTSTSMCMYMCTSTEPYPIVTVYSAIIGSVSAPTLS